MRSSAGLKFNATGPDAAAKACCGAADQLAKLICSSSITAMNKESLLVRFISIHSSRKYIRTLFVGLTARKI
jgi:hypothetical protein